MKLFEKMEKNEVGSKEVKRRKRSTEKGSSAEAVISSECKGHKTVTDEPVPSPVAETKHSDMSAVETAEVGEVSSKEVKRREHSMVKGSSAEAVSSSEYKGHKTVTDVPLQSPVAETKHLEMSAVETAEIDEVSSKEVKRRKCSTEKGSSAEAVSSSEHKGLKTVTDVPLPSPVAEMKPLEMSAVETAEVGEVSSQEVERQAHSMDRESSAEAVNSSECEGHKTVADVPLLSPDAEMKPSEVSVVVTAAVKNDDTETGKSEVGKKVKRRKRSTQKGSSTEAVNSSECIVHNTVADVPLPSPVAETKPSEMSAVETIAVKHDNTESSTVDIIDTKATVNAHTTTDMVQGNDQSDIIDNATNDLHNSDFEAESLRGISESCLTLNASPNKPIMQRTPIGTKLLEKIPHVKHDTDNSDAAVNASIAVTNQQTTIENEVKFLEEMPSVKLSKHDSDITSAEGARSAAAIENDVKLSEEMPSVELLRCDASITAADKPNPVTTKLIQTDVKAKTMDKVKKSDIDSEAQSRALKRGLKPLSTAKLKFGMYSRRPLAPRAWVKVDEHDVKSRSDSEDDKKDEHDITSESETMAKPKCHSVKVAWYF